MLKKGSKLYGIIKGVCPKCHNQPMYKNPNPYAIIETFEMHDHCSHCNTKYKIEPSFFYGSMYVSYGVGIIFAISTFLICYLYFETNLKIAFIIIIIIITLIFFYPIILRLSRNIWINLFLNYTKHLD